jgi:hypothetical protein
MAGVVLSGAGCPIGQSTDPGSAIVLPPVPEGAMLLVLENQSGLEVTVDVSFEATGQQIRQTTRVLQPTGNESVATLLRTVADHVVVSAKVGTATQFAPGAKYNPGFVLATGDYRKGVDFEEQGTIFFVIPLPPADCDNNGNPDSADIASGASQDCNGNGVPDQCDLATQKSMDCNANSIPDECEIASGQALDCNHNGVPDSCEITAGTAADCNHNGIPDECEIASGQALDCNHNNIPDACEIADGAADCNQNGIPDSCEIASGDLTDCNLNGIPDSCDIAAGTSHDCNENGVPDECEIPQGEEAPGGPFFCTTQCAADCNYNGVPDSCDIASGTSADCNHNGIPDECEIASGKSRDCNNNGIPDDCDLESVERFHQIGEQDPLSTDLLFPLNNTFALAMGPNDDGYTAEIPLGFSFDLYGVTYNSVFINNNGNLSFGAPFFQFTSTGFPVQGFPMVAPFWADVDTRSANGQVWYKITDNTLIVIWDIVGYFNQHGDKRNTFEVAISDGTNTTMGLGNNLCFSYGNMQWTTGDASGGVGGFGGVPATVGANRGNGEDSFQIGRFVHRGTDYDGPFGSNDGVDYLIG